MDNMYSSRLVSNKVKSKSILKIYLNCLGETIDKETKKGKKEKLINQRRGTKYQKDNLKL